MYFYQGQEYFQEFCSQLNRFLRDKVHFSFYSVFTLPPDQGEMPEGELVSDDAWYHHITKDKDEEVSIPTCISYEKSTASSIDFGLGMNLVY